LLDAEPIVYALAPSSLLTVQLHRQVRPLQQLLQLSPSHLPLHYQMQVLLHTCTLLAQVTYFHNAL
jgi:hypothetical protein